MIKKKKLFEIVRKWMIANHCSTCLSYLYCFTNGFSGLDAVYKDIIEWRQDESEFHKYQCPKYKIDPGEANEPNNG